MPDDGINVMEIWTKDQIFESIMGICLLDYSTHTWKATLCLFNNTFNLNMFYSDQNSQKKWTKMLSRLAKLMVGCDEVWIVKFYQAIP